MIASVVDFEKDRVIYNVSGCTKAELDYKIELFFIAEGYKLESAKGETNTYVKGNRAMRLLLGAFVKYFKQSVTVKNEGSAFSVMLHKDSSGISGGLIGMNQVKKEFSRLSEAFTAHLK